MSAAETVFVAVDIGCLECGESSALLGIFDTEAEAEKVCDAAREKQKANWTGQHSFEVFPHRRGTYERR